MWWDQEQSHWAEINLIIFVNLWLKTEWKHTYLISLLSLNETPKVPIHKYNKFQFQFQVQQVVILVIIAQKKLII
jgi:hypothetical protein